MLLLVVHKFVVDDLAEVRKDNPDAAKKIAALIIELKGDQDLQDRLTQHDYGAHRSEEFHISVWTEEQKKNRNLWRLKLWALENQGIKYRIIYAFQPKLKRHVVLAVAPRDFNYGDEHPLTERIRTVYDSL